MHETQHAIEPGFSYKIKSLSKNGDPTFRKRLMSMGFIPGARFSVLRIAPLGDPIQISVHGYSLSLRASDLGCLDYEVVNA